MKSRRKLFFRFGILPACLAVPFLVYSHVGLFPGPLLPKALAEIGRLTGKNVACEKILFLPFRGFVFDSPKIYEKNGAFLFRAGRLSAHVALVPFFREKKILIDRLVMEEPVYELSLEKDKPKKEAPPKTVISGQLEVPVAGDGGPLTLEKISSGPDILLPENVYLEEVRIENGRVLVRKDKNSPVIEELNGIDVRVGFQKPPLLKFEGRLKLGADRYGAVDLNGEWDLANDRYQFIFSTLSKKVPQWLIDYQKKNFLALDQGEFYLKTSLQSAPDDRVLFQSQAHLKNSRLRTSSSHYEGSMHLTAEGAFDSVQKKFSHYHGSLELLNVNAANLSPKIQSLEALAGLVEFEHDLLNIHSMRGIYKNVPFEASGTVRSFKELQVQGRIVSDLRIDQLLALLSKQQREKLEGFELEGRCQALTLLTGSLKKDSRLETEYQLNIQDGHLKNTSRDLDLTGVSAELGVNKRGLEIHSAKFTASKIPWEIRGFIPQGPETPGWLEIRSHEIQLRADYALDGETVKIKNAKATLPGMSAAFHGDALYWMDPELRLEGDLEIQLAKIDPPLPPDQKIFLKNLSLEGALHGPFILNGPWKSPLDWEFKMDAESQAIFLKKNLRMDKFQLQARMKDRKFDIPYARSEFYGGTVNARALLDLGGPEVFFDSRISAKQVDLSQVGPLLDPPNKTLSGNLIGQILLQGKLQKPETYTGQGSVSVARGFLWETSEFKDMGNLPLVKVEGLEKVTFTDMNATFEIADKKIFTHDLALKSQTVDLSLDGAVGFDGQLDLAMDIGYSNDVHLGAMDTGGIVPLVVGQAEGLISQYHVSGTLKEPKYDKILAPGRSIGKKIGGLVNSII